MIIAGDLAGSLASLYFGGADPGHATSGSLNSGLGGAAGVTHASFRECPGSRFRHLGGCALVDPW